LEYKPSPGFRNVYPITLIEQKEMDTFLEEALATGLMRQSKSPLRAPIFIIKKKDEKLYFVQDYCALNTITCKNHYPLPLINNLIHCLKDATSPSLTCAGDTIISVSKRAMSGRQHIN
jgi:hypothetical protein